MRYSVSLIPAIPPIAATTVSWCPLTPYQLVASVLSLATLIVLFIYAWDTKRIKEAAEEQAEGIQKPCVVVELQPNLFVASGESNLTGRFVLRTLTGNMTLRNIGQGPAIDVRIKFLDQQSADETVAEWPCPSVAFIEARESFRVGVPDSVIGHHLALLIQYESATGRSYETHYVLGLDKFEGVEFSRRPGSRRRRQLSPRDESQSR
jgi:hypothetical protein